MPGLIWFYYDFFEENCNSPVDEHISLMVILYFVISIIMFVLAINSCLNCREINACLISLYILSKLGLGITMLTFIQRDYYGNWDDNTCSYLKPLTLFWLIWNYVIICISFILGCIYFIGGLIECCDC